jgi:mediator of RNA polymerase II transcription subunit 13, fungi type
MKSRLSSLPAFGKSEEYFHAPAFTLVGPEPSFQMTAVQRNTLDVTERHTILHFAYQISDCGRWLMVTCVDQVGHTTDVKVWALEDRVEDGDYDSRVEIIRHIWTFVIEVAKKADIEWRIVICRIGAMGELELRGMLLKLYRILEYLLLPQHGILGYLPSLRSKTSEWSL